MRKKTRSCLQGVGLLGLLVLMASLFGCMLDLFPDLVPIGPATVFIADTGNHVIRRLACDGTMTTIAGTGVAGFSGDGGSGPATAAKLNSPITVFLDHQQNLYIADAGNFRIRKVDTHGTITTIVGNGTPGYTGDGGLATAAQISGLAVIWVNYQGILYFTDVGNHCIRKVDENGIVTTIAGTGLPGFSGDGGPADLAQLNSPAGIWGNPSGDLYFSDMGNHRIRMISDLGTIDTVAGTGTPGFSGDGGLAQDAELNSPAGLWGSKAAGIFFADMMNHRIRQITQKGTIVTVAGNGVSGFGIAEQWPATLVMLNGPLGVATINSHECRVLPDPFP